MSLLDGRFERACRKATLEAVLRAHLDASAFGVDIPIGLPDGPEDREADRLARREVGRLASSVFLVSCRAVLEETDYARAVQRARRMVPPGRAPSRQLWGLRGRILEADRLAVVGGPIREVHPELSFREMAGKPLRWSKRTWNGLSMRRALLITHGIVPPAEIAEIGTAGPDDVLDAAAAAWTAQRIVSGTARSVPPEPTTDELGRPVAIWV